MRGQDDMGQMFETLTTLTPLQRAAAAARYRFLMNEYRCRGALYAFMFYLLRITMTVGSLSVPALLSFKTQQDQIETLYWLTWSISLAVTAANGLLTLFKVEKRYYLIRAVAERIRTETWQFLNLSGRYSGHYGGGFRPTHTNQYIYYSSRIEKVRMRHIDDEYVRPSTDSEDKKIVPAVLTTGETVKAQAAATQDVPTPADQSTLHIQPKTPSDRKDSLSSVGSDDTVIELVSAKPDKKKAATTKDAATETDGAGAPAAEEPAATGSEVPTLSVHDRPRQTVPPTGTTGIAVLQSTPALHGQPSIAR
jgi:hypothetical protein